jgi:nicotinate-nucleotide adenylyltransferase
MALKRVGLLGGSFDPITTSHMRVISYLLGEGVVDGVWLLPVHTHSDAKRMAAYEHRMAMARIVANTKYNTGRPHAADPLVHVSDFESTYETGGQTYPTLLKFLATFNPLNDKQFYFIIGLDNALTIDRWDDHEKLIQLLPFIVLPRGPDPPKQDSWFLKPPHLYLGSFHDPDDGSSTKARSHLREKRTSPLVVREVLEYIDTHGLYTAVEGPLQAHTTRGGNTP